MFGRRSRFCVDSTRRLGSIWIGFPMAEMSKNLMTDSSARVLR
uniref:Uncharacterized protein n=2 Tax=Brassica campestris TaxID=3711 RepID=A0A3P6CYS0_BRACM|nr:unnamed protein product [Brassica rapa]